MTPLILELDEVLNKNEEMVSIQTIGINEGKDSIIGYVAMIKDFSGVNKVRYGNLKATPYIKKKFNNVVL